ncbi:DinB family protein [Tunturiibacter gelidiferens]|uniref:DinB family protein n=1 Tax=Tunturiibacter gelidiferens TaxID=3069689 RepID=UPI003D9AEEC0
MKTLLLLVVMCTSSLHAQMEGLWEGYDGEWTHVSRQLVALAEATPADKFAWRPAPGVRSTSEVYMHIALANFYLLSVTGPAMPADIKSQEMEKTVTSKADVIAFLKRSLDAVKTARAQLKPGSFSGRSRLKAKR